MHLTDHVARADGEIEALILMIRSLVEHHDHAGLIRSTFSTACDTAHANMLARKVCDATIDGFADARAVLSSTRRSAIAA